MQMLRKQECWHFRKHFRKHNCFCQVERSIAAFLHVNILRFKHIKQIHELMFDPLFTRDTHAQTLKMWMEVQRREDYLEKVQQ